MKSVSLGACIALLVQRPAPTLGQVVSGVTLTISPVREHQSSQRVEILVLLENSDPTLSWTLVPRIVMAPGRPLKEPFPQLLVVVRDPQGRELESHFNLEPDLRRAMTTCDFSSLAPLTSIGRRVDLTKPPFSFVFGEPGTYVVHAKVLSVAKDWLKVKRRKDPCSRNLERVFDGVVEATPAIVKVDPVPTRP